jgi:hypothetical protein
MEIKDLLELLKADNIELFVALDNSGEGVFKIESSRFIITKEDRGDGEPVIGLLLKPDRRKYYKTVPDALVNRVLNE